MLEATPLSSHPNLSAKAYEILRREIVTCELAPGTRIEVVELARRLGVSRSPITDALNKLSGEGLVEEEPRKGYFVTSLDLKDYVELLEARLMVELAVAEKAIARVSAEDVARLHSLIAQQQTYLDPQGNYADYPRWVETDHEFHRAVVDIAGNKYIANFHSRLNTHVHMTRIYYSEKMAHRPSSASIAEHSAVANAFGSHDLTALKAAMTYHIRETARFFTSSDLVERLE